MIRSHGIVIAGATSGVGKTTISSAVMHGLIKKGYKVQPFKIGPDYIDPYYHNIITKKKSKNLDVWLMGLPGVMECYYSSSKDTDFSVVEGVMGLFDGLSGKNNYASTAHISKILDIPVILIVDAAKTARSLAASTLGYLKFDRSVKIDGVIINNIASDRHLKYIKEAFESKIKVPIVGKIYRNKNLVMHERHLGLIPIEELDIDYLESIKHNSKLIAENIDIEKIIDIAKNNNKNRVNRNLLKNYEKITPGERKKIQESKIKISIALDKSFNFYYQDNLEILHKKTNIEFFSPLNDNFIPDDCSGIILGGGFPEVIADKLEENTTMKRSILRLAEDNMPIYAECGGLMYLTNTIRGYKNKKRKYKMVNLFDADTVMTKKLTLGYTKARLLNNESFFKNIKLIKGHEFHYSNILLNNDDLKMIYNLDRGTGIKDGKDGFHVYNCIASYMHMHFINNLLSKGFIDSCIKYSRK